MLPESKKIKIKLLRKKLKSGASVCQACRRIGISRTTYYRWQKKIGSVSLKRSKLRGNKEPIPNFKKILRLVASDPNSTCQQLAQQVGKSQTFVWRILNKHRLGTRRERRKWARQLKIYPSRKRKYSYSFETRKMLLETAQKKGVSYACREFGVSRALFYKWKRRFQAGESLENKKWQVLRWGRQASEEYEQMVLGLVVKHPELSVHKIVPNLPKIAGASIVGHHGVQNILRRNGLNTLDKRLNYARLHAPAIRIQPLTGWLERLKTVWETFVPAIAPAPPPKLIEITKAFLASFASSSVLTLIFLFWLSILSGQPISTKFGLSFTTIALTCGTFFFLYSMRYYFTLAVVLSFSRQAEEPAVLGLTGEFKQNGNGWLARIFGLGNGPSAGASTELSRMSLGLNGKERKVVGLKPNLESVKLEKHPFVSIHLPFYNEKKVAGRILKACASFDYPNYEVVVCDDSTDKTTDIVQRYAKLHNRKHPYGPKIKIIHRKNRSGFKGGALREALKASSPETEFVVVFDADFIPYPDTLELFLKYFKTYNHGSENFAKSNIAAVQGYQWHVLNKSENWITRGVRSEYAGSYVIERSGTEILGALRQIAGSVYMIRTDVLRKFGWGTSITEDFELTLKLYEQGYKVVYTPYIQGPAECVSTVKRLIGQRMRWSEGHSHCVKKMFTRLLKTPNMTRAEKLEFLYLSPYYLQAFFFLVGTLSWLMAETVFRARLPFWTSLWGWSLVLTNFFSLPLMNAVGLFLEESEQKDYLGLISFIVLSYIMVPFQAYASVKGFLEKEEGPWFRTPKTGKITDVFTRGRFYRWITGILPGRAASRALAPAPAGAGIQANAYIALATANNQFSNFKIRPRHLRRVGKMMMIFLIISSLLIGQLAWKVPLASATAGTQIKTVEFFLYQRNSATEITAGNGVDNTTWGATCGSGDSDPSVSITIPESGIVTFQQVIVEWRTWQSAASGTAATDYDIQFCNSSTTASDSGSGTVTTSSAENNMVLVRLEASAAMSAGTNTYWFDARLVGATRNLDSMKIYITYEYDQTSATQLKTVRFYGNQQTGASSTTNLDAVINPNLTEGSITVRDSFAEFKGQVNGADDTISGSFAASGTCGTASAVAVADGGLASAYGYFVLFDMSDTINLTTSNCIRHGVNVAAFARSIEWVITFEYSYYSTAEADDLLHTKTVRYMMGTVQAALPLTQTNVGTQAIALPENRPASPFTSAYLQYFSSLDDAETLETCISTAAACTGTTSTQTGIQYGDTTEQSGGIWALDDVTAFFNTNYSGTSTTFSASARGTVTASDLWGTSAEVIITYKFNADTSSTTIKTVYFWVGQETLSRTNTAFTQASEESQANFNTWWPETGTKTFRNGAVYCAFDFNGTSGVPLGSTITATITIDTAEDGTDTAVVDISGTGENMTREFLMKISTQVPTPFVAQSDINFSMTTSSTTLPVFRSPIAYFTVETATSLAPEFAVFFIPLAIILPLGMRIYLDNKKRGLNND